jgi:Domain of unknown function (DUF4157)
MRAFAPKQNPTPTKVSPRFANQHPRSADPERDDDSVAAATPRGAYDFAKISVQPKMPAAPRAQINPPNDTSERQADALADHVTRILDPRGPSQRTAQPAAGSATNHGGTAVNGTLRRRISSALGSGSGMDLGTRALMQRGFGADFSQVRIHKDGEAARMSGELGASAFTVGRDIFFGSGKYSPGTRAGRHLLAHELTHTIQQRSPRVIQRQPQAHRQSEVGLGIMNEEERAEAPALAEPDPMQIQRSTAWAGATVHETRNKAEDSLLGGAPVTWQMLNGTMLKTEADADGSIKAPTLATSGSGTDFKSKVDTVPAQEGADDETVLSPGPWTKVAPKADIGARFGIAACTGDGDSTFRAIGKPSDDAVYKANRRHEDHHVADDKAAFEQTVGVWDKKLEEAKSKGSEFKGADAAKAEAALWTGMGGIPTKVARDYRSLSFTKGGAFHATAAGGPMVISNAKSSADCSTSSIDVTNPS